MTMSLGYPTRPAGPCRPRFAAVAPLRSPACPQGASLVHLPVRKALLSFTRLSARRFSRASACPQGAAFVHPPVRKALLSCIRLSARRYFPTALRCRRPIRSSPDRPRCRRPFQVAVIRQQFSSLDLLLFGVRCTILPLLLFQLVRSSRLSGGLLKRRNCTARSLLSYTVFYYMGGPNPDEPERIRPCE